MNEIWSTTPSKQDLLNYVSEKYGNNKNANKLKRLIFKSYSGKYIFYLDKKFDIDKESLDKLYNLVNEKE
jgi:hypothetical protein